MYWFLDDHDTVLYVGKAKNLKQRIASYKQWQQTTGKTRRLVFHATRLKHEVLESELEAILVEAELIRTHQPQYNIMLKDDKTPLYVVITEEKYPRVLTTRKKEIEQHLPKGTVLGPFQSSFQLHQVLQHARKIFPYCTGHRNKDYGTPQGRPCFEYHLDLCPGTCIGAIPPEAYREQINNLTLFLRGKKKEVLRELEQEMQQAAATEQYERAAQLRDQVQLIKVVTERSYRLRPDISLPKLKESLRAEGLIYLRRLLSTHFALPKTFPLTRIEGYDVSNIQGTSAAVAQVVFLNGVPAKGEYRLFNIRLLNTPNDFAMLQEALQRRQNHLEWGIPSLLVIDGGKGQLRSVLKVWHWTTPVISIAKNPDRLIFPHFEKIETDHGRDVDLKTLRYEEVKLPGDHPTLHLIQHIRDEAHRFSKKQHRSLREKKMVE